MSNNSTNSNTWLMINSNLNVLLEVTKDKHDNYNISFGDYLEITLDYYTYCDVMLSNSNIEYVGEL